MPAATQQRPTIAYLTAGAAGMYCGSCMRDNTLAAALARRGVDIRLMPTYTPIRTDEQNVSVDDIFFGGINVYLQERLALFRWLPRALDRWLDRPWLINSATSRGIETDARMLGALTVSMLQGERGRQKKEVHRLLDWLRREVKPDLINLSNILIGGFVPLLKRTLNIPILVTLQGDDLFLDDLPEPYQSQAKGRIREIADHVDGFITFSDFYADHMAKSLGLPREKIEKVTLGIHLDDQPLVVRDHSPIDASRPATIGYFARVCPAKGLHVLVDAYLKLRRMHGMERTRLAIAGWLGSGDKRYWDEQWTKIVAASAAGLVTMEESVDRDRKRSLMRQADILSVPTTYREPKGLYVLESLAQGTPVLQPEHGAFPELLASTGGGRLVRPEDSDHLAEELASLLRDHRARDQLGREGQRSVYEKHHDRVMADETWAIYARHLGLTHWGSTRETRATITAASQSRE